MVPRLLARRERAGAYKKTPPAAYASVSSPPTCARPPIHVRPPGVCMVERGQFVRSTEPRAASADMSGFGRQAAERCRRRARRLSSPQGSSSADSGRPAD